MGAPEIYMAAYLDGGSQMHLTAGWRERCRRGGGDVEGLEGSEKSGEDEPGRREGGVKASCCFYIVQSCI